MVAVKVEVVVPCCTGQNGSCCGGGLVVASTVALVTGASVFLFTGLVLLAAVVVEIVAECCDGRQVLSGCVLGRVVFGVVVGIGDSKGDGVV